MELHNQKTNNGRGTGDGPLIILRKVGKIYATPAGHYPALRDVGLDFLFEPSRPLVWLGVSICLGMVTSLLLAWYASRRPAREAIVYE